MLAPRIQLIVSKPATKQTMLCFAFELAECCALRRLQQSCAELYGVPPDAVQSMGLLDTTGGTTLITSDRAAAALTPLAHIVIQCVGEPPLGAGDVDRGRDTVSCSEIDVKCILKTGTISTVHEGEWRSTRVAIKMLQSDGQCHGAMSRLNSELELLSRLHHPRLVTLMAICRDVGPEEGSLALVLEFMEGGCLFHKLHPAAGSTYASAAMSSSHARCGLTVLEKLRIALDVTEGMRFLRDSGINHMDLKSANILLDSACRAKISDYGLSALCTHHVTPAWIAPEILRGEDFRPSADVYSVGVIVWELFSEREPWYGKASTEIVTLVTQQRLKLTDSAVAFVAVPAPSVPLSPLPTLKASPVLLRRGTTKRLLELVQSCFQDAETRPSFADLHVDLQSISQSEIEKPRIASPVTPAMPPGFHCPITDEVMQDPVICSDGHTYERGAIKTWLLNSNRSPMTNLELSNKNLIPNLALRSVIEPFLILERIELQ
jgi:serine/threonine protein kinase